MFHTKQVVLYGWKTKSREQTPFSLQEKNPKTNVLWVAAKESPTLFFKIGIAFMWVAVKTIEDRRVQNNLTHILIGEKYFSANVVSTMSSSSPIDFNESKYFIILKVTSNVTWII